MDIKRNHGFTLIELVLVISILGIVAASAIPAILDTQTVNLSTATQKLEQDLRYAQMLSTTTGDLHGFRTIAPAVQGDSSTTYEVYNVSSGDVIESPYHHLDMTENLDDEFPGVVFDTGYDIEFDSLGRPTTNTGTNTITLSNDSEESREMTINSNTGLITVVNPDEGS
jgi:prepilin-type N-terminal cleavage/methylation domain-containing protein